MCDSGVNALHFNSNDQMRYMVSTDVMVTEKTFLQFELAMGCTQSNQCYSESGKKNFPSTKMLMRWMRNRRVLYPK